VWRGPLRLIPFRIRNGLLLRRLFRRVHFVLTRAEQVLDRGLESDKEDNPFLHGVDAIVEALPCLSG
jgi:hypothetical protein